MRRSTRKTFGRAGGFTLTEMLAVLFILMILLTLVLGVSKYIMDDSAAKQTRATMKIVKTAVTAYAAAYSGTLPPEYVVPTSQTDSVIISSGYRTNEAMTVLGTDTVTKDLIAKLPVGVYTAQSGLKDGWGNVIRYQQTGSLGVPVLVSSAGAQFTLTASRALDLDKGEYIRSDRE